MIKDWPFIIISNSYCIVVGRHWLSKFKMYLISPLYQWSKDQKNLNLITFLQDMPCHYDANHCQVKQDLANLKNTPKKVPGYKTIIPVLSEYFTNLRNNSLILTYKENIVTDFMSTAKHGSSVQNTSLHQIFWISSLDIPETVSFVKKK